ncbi:MAG: FtsQ-type POTRA domain-containing protein [Clostridia bacterium]|nr:FtsQ-type POTRA domain-containing protein [Clostridia bacterium]
MDRAETITRNSVRDRAQRYSKSPDRIARVWDDSMDAVPIGKKRSSASERAPTEKTRTGGRIENPYRVRESMARAGKKHAAAQDMPRDGTSRQPRGRVRTDAEKARVKQSAQTQPRAGERPGHRSEHSTEIPRRFEDILREDTMSDTERVQAYQRAVRQKTFARLRRVGLAVLIGVVFLVCALVLVYKLAYVVNDITVTGASLYSPETILDAAGVEEGQNLYSFSSRVVQNRVTLHCPYVRSLHVDRQAPDTVYFAVTEDEATFSAYIYGELRALSPSLRVLDSVTEDEAAANGLIRLCLPAVNQAVAGRVIVFENERGARMIRDIAAAVLASPLSDRITAVDLTDAHTLRMVCDGQFLLNFGDTKDVAVKLKIASAVLQDSLFSTAVKAQIDLTATDETSVVLDDQLDLNW